jgi:hypothetical protein
VGMAQTAVTELCHIAMPVIPTLSVPFYASAWASSSTVTVMEGDRDAEVDEVVAMAVLNVERAASLCQDIHVVWSHVLR